CTTARRPPPRPPLFPYTTLFRSEGGVRGGLPQNLAAQLAHATLGGAAAMLSESGLSSRELREMVVSPGGTTQAGLTSLDSLHFRDAVIAAVEAATRRARELAAA